MKTKFTFIIVLLISLFIYPNRAYCASSSVEAKSSAASAMVSNAKSEEKRDYRAKILKKYLEQFNSPLASMAQTFVNEADRNDIDWRLVAAISGVESTFGKQIPTDSYNAWGWGVYGDNVYYFKSFEDGITTISKGLKENYINKWGAKDVYEIGRFYAASPTWAQRVTFFMENMDKFALDNPTNTLSLSL